MRYVVYIAGSISDENAILVAQHLHRFTQVENALLRAGFAPINPGADWDAVALGGVEYEALMERDRAVLAKCDAAYFMTGWKNSSGAKREHKFAAWVGIPCIEEDYGDEENGFSHLTIALRGITRAMG